MQQYSSNETPIDLKNVSGKKAHVIQEQEEQAGKAHNFGIHFVQFQMFLNHREASAVQEKLRDGPSQGRSCGRLGFQGALICDISQSSPACWSLLE